MRTNRLKAIIKKFSQAKILVLGDLILDEFIWGDVERISPEAPVPVVWAKKRSYLPGGAANVANNLRSLGAKVSLVGVVGKDHNCNTLISELRRKGIDTRAIFSEPNRLTTLKSRIFARHQHVVRVDWEHVDPLRMETRKKIGDFILGNIKNFDAVIIEDYGKGVIERCLLEEVISLSRRFNKIITVDPKEDHFQYYHGVSAITPNRKEAENAVRYLKIKDKENKFKVYDDGLNTPAEIRKAGYALLAHLDLACLLITLGEEGMWIFQKDGGDQHIPTVAQEVFDVSGAGDTVIATFTLGICCGASQLEAAHIANFAAGTVVEKLGVATTTQTELLKGISK